MTTDTVALTARPSRVGRVLLQLFLVMLFAVLVMAVLCFIPRTSTLGKSGSRDAVSRVTAGLRALEGLRRGRTVGRSFKETDINGYMQYSLARRMKVESISVDVGEGFVRARMVRKFGPLSLGPIELEPKMSFDVACVPVGGALAVRKSAMGLMPLVGPLKSIAARPVYDRLSAQAEWKALHFVSEIRAENDALWIQAQR